MRRWRAAARSADRPTKTPARNDVRRDRAITAADPHETSAYSTLSGRLAALSRWIIAHRRRVLVSWLAIAVAGVALVGPAVGRLSSSEQLPGLPSYEQGLAIVRDYDTGGNNLPSVLLATLPGSMRAGSAAGRARLRRAFAPLEGRQGLRVIAYPQVEDSRLVGRNGHSAIAIVFGSAAQPTSAALVDLLRAHLPAGMSISGTSLKDLYDAPGNAGLGVLAETLIGGAGALVVLALVFGSPVAVIPVLVAGVSILTTLLLVGLMTYLTPVSQLMEYLVALIGLGVAIDYSLLIVTRWREERDAGRDNDDAIVAATASAGRAVAFSGVTVAAGLLTLVALPIPFLRSLGYGGMLIPIVTVLAEMSLVPALLSACGPALDRRSRRAHRHGRSRAWAAWVAQVTRHPRVAMVSALLIIGVLATLASDIRVGEAASTSLTRTGLAEQGLTGLRHAGIPAGVLTPVEIMVPADAGGRRLVDALRAIPGVDTVVAPSLPQWRRHGTALFDALLDQPTSSTSAEEALEGITETLHRVNHHAAVAGDGAEERDLVHAYYSRFPLIVALTLLISGVTLAAAFRSVLIPVKAVIVNALSLAAAYGALVVIWQDGDGSHLIWGIPATGVIVDFVPLLLFAFLFGISMDYEIFIMSRIAESRRSGRATPDAIVEGLARTGRLVTCAAVILFLAFASLAAAPSVPVKVFATGMGIGILFDATVIRALLVPAILTLMGEGNWWWPTGAARRDAARAEGDLQPTPNSDLAGPNQPWPTSRG